MLRVYLLVNTFLYLLFAVLCIAKPMGTANTLGYSFLNNSGRAEYLSIYTGLESGFAIFLAICAFSPRLSLGGLIFLVCIYAGVMIIRPVCALCYGNMLTVTWLAGALEWALGIWGIILLAGELRK